MITQHILPNISRSKGNQTVKFHHLMEYNKYHSLKKNHSQKVFFKTKKRSRTSLSVSFAA